MSKRPKTRAKDTSDRKQYDSDRKPGERKTEAIPTQKAGHASRKERKIGGYGNGGRSGFEIVSYGN